MSARGERVAWGAAALGVVVSAGLGLALIDAREQLASAEARLVVAEREAEPGPGRAERAGRAARTGRRAGGPLGRGGRADAPRRGAVQGRGGEETTPRGAAAEEHDEATALAAERSDAGAETRAERALASLEVAIADLDLEPDLADEVRVIYEDTFEAGARIRDELRDGERDEDSAREAQQRIRSAAREELEALLEPEELKHIRRTIRRGGRGRL